MLHEELIDTRPGLSGRKAAASEHDFCSESQDEKEDRGHLPQQGTQV